MTKLIFILTIILPIITNSQEVLPANSARIEYGIKPTEMAGIIRSITTTCMSRQEYNFDSPLLFYDKYQIRYDTSGLQEQYKIWNADGNLISHGYCVYNKSYTQLVKIEYVPTTVKARQNYVAPTEIWESYYVCWRLDTLSNQIISKKEYNSNGIIQRLIEYGADTSILKVVHEFDSLGNIIYREELVDDIKYREYWRYTYDARGNILTRLTMNESGKIIYDSRYTYDEFNRKLSDLCKSIYADDSIAYVYNAYGDIVLETRTCDDPKRNYRSRTEYKYDGRGNWISRVVYFDEVDVFRYTRVIEYYD